MPQPGYPGYAPQPRNNGLAIASLVLGIVGFALCGVGSILAIIFGFISKSQIDKSGGTQKGRGMAMAGIILGFAFVALLVVLLIVAAATGGVHGNVHVGNTGNSGG